MLVAPSRWKIKTITSQKARGTCLCLFMGSAQRELAGGTGQKVVSFLCNNLWQPAAPELARCEMTCLQHLWVGRLRDTCWEMVELEFAGEGNIQACLPTAAGCLEVSLQESGCGRAHPWDWRPNTKKKGSARERVLSANALMAPEHLTGMTEMCWAY